jgi:glycosyltransferase involved in cell wall biosynthesis
MKVSIITVCKNAENTIENTIQSVVAQNYKNIEYIVIDGASSDKTLEMINKYRDKISYFISEPDSGLYNAMNKAIKSATGNILFFLNADDVLYDENVVKDVVSEFFRTKADFLYGNLTAVYPENKKEILQKSETVDKFFWMNQCICHQVIFYKADLFKKYGFYDENYKIAADYDFNLRAIIKNKCKTYYFDRIIAKFTMGGLGHSNKNIYDKEQKEISIKYFGETKIKFKEFLFKNCRSIIRTNFLRKLINLFF